MKHAIYSIFMLCVAQQTFAAEPLTGAQFDAYATGKTLTFAENGKPYGSEQYLPNKRVRWAAGSQTCLEGRWYEEADQICFAYQDNSAPQCWTFYLEDDKLIAEFDAGESTVVYEAWDSLGSLSCMAPGLGV
ncbi:hypothetical protein [Pacificibacter maritimus]|nr:hypothetical protein [Pacificibacter maritimus]